MDKQMMLDAINAKCRSQCSYLDEPQYCKQRRCPLHDSATKPKKTPEHFVDNAIYWFCGHCVQHSTTCEGCPLKPYSPIKREDLPQKQPRPQYRRIRSRALTYATA